MNGWSCRGLRILWAYLISRALRTRRAAIGRWACEKWVSQVRFWVSQQKVKIAA